MDGGYAVRLGDRLRAHAEEKGLIDRFLKDPEAG
jgi:hypothetical protein